MDGRGDDSVRWRREGIQCITRRAANGDPAFITIGHQPDPGMAGGALEDFGGFPEQGLGIQRRVVGRGPADWQ